MSENTTQAFVKAYMQCAIWASLDDDDEPLDASHDIDDIDDETVRCMTAECQAFIEANREDLDRVDRDYAHSGHDFWLTRNGHGTGFWDRYYGDDSDLRDAYERLSEASKTYGECHLYVGDDGKLHI